MLGRAILPKGRVPVITRKFVGESRIGRLLFLALVSRFFDRPLSVAMKGPSSGGKSYITDRVLDFFPESAFFKLTSCSEKALIYTEEPLRHRFLVLAEASGTDQQNFLEYIIRSLLSENQIIYETVERVDDRHVGHTIIKEGPTGLLLTTTKTSLHPENETRMLSLLVKDTPEQTAAVFQKLAGEAMGEEAAIDLRVWHDYQTWLESGEHTVLVPFAGTLARLVPPLAVRLRRDFKLILQAIKAHALMHRVTRERDHQGRIVATLDDYEIVRELLSMAVADGVGAEVKPETREVVRAVTELTSGKKEHDGVTAKQVGEQIGKFKDRTASDHKKCGLDKSAAYRRLKVAEKGGFVANKESQPRRPGRYVLADDLPDNIEVLPSREALDGTFSRNNGATDPEESVEIIEDFDDETEVEQEFLVCQ